MRINRQATLNERLGLIFAGSMLMFLCTVFSILAITNDNKTPIGGAILTGSLGSFFLACACRMEIPENEPEAANEVESLQL